MRALAPEGMRIAFSRDSLDIDTKSTVEEADLRLGSFCVIVSSILPG
jgi:hypothetical protein